MHLKFNQDKYELLIQILIRAFCGKKTNYQVKFVKMSESNASESVPQGESDVTSAAADEEATREREELDTYVSELKAKIELKMKLRNENLTCVRPGEDYFFKLDSSLKKNTAFVKKLKQFTAAQLDALLKDMYILYSFIYLYAEITFYAFSFYVTP